MGILQIATVGPETDPVMVGVREYPVSKLILIHRDDDRDRVRELEDQLGPLKLDIETRALDGDVLLGVLRTVTEIVAEEQDHHEDVYINVTSGDQLMSCAALSAAFVNGIKAFGVRDGQPVQMPVLKFSYQELVSESKFEILEALQAAGGSVESLNDLAETSGLEKSLLSYHIRGGRDSKGLEELGLVDVDRGVQGRLEINLSSMGELLLAGRSPLVEEA